MIKKNLGLLAGSILLASGVNAAVVTPGTLGDAEGSSTTTGSDMVLLLIDENNDETLVYNAGLTADTLAGGGAVGFSVDLTSNASYAGFTATSYALFGVTGGSTTYSTSVGSYADTGVGAVYAGSGITDVPPSSAALRTNWSELNAYISLIANPGKAGVITAGQSYNNQTSATFFGGLIHDINATTDIFLAESTGDGSTVGSEVEITNNIFGNLQEAFVLADTFYVQTAVPVPAAAWLFGTAMLGLSVARRRKA